LTAERLSSAESGQRRAGAAGGAPLTGRQEVTRDFLRAAGRFISAQDLHARLRAAGHGIGLTTVYRALRVLAERGAADVRLAEDGRRVYRARAGGRPHWLACRRCGRTAGVLQDDLERWAAQTAARHGFTGVTCMAALTGTCPECAAAGAG
jgi:Fur family transcriptional regulator, ferric uptake regulator